MSSHCPDCRLPCRRPRQPRDPDALHSENLIEFRRPARSQKTNWCVILPLATYRSTSSNLDSGNPQVVIPSVLSMIHRYSADCYNLCGFFAKLSGSANLVRSDRHWVATRCQPWLPKNDWLSLFTLEMAGGMIRFRQVTKAEGRNVRHEPAMEVTCMAGLRIALIGAVDGNRQRPGQYAAFRPIYGRPRNHRRLRLTLGGIIRFWGRGLMSYPGRTLCETGERSLVPVHARGDGTAGDAGRKTRGSCPQAPHFGSAEYGVPRSNPRNF